MNSEFFLKLFTEATQQARYNKELVPAKAEFQKIAGQIMDSDRSYIARVNAFHNWYILDREMTGNGQTPHRYYLEYNRNSLDERSVQGLGELADNIHSVFHLLGLKKDAFVVRDLMSNKKYSVEGAEQVASLDPGEVFNSRIFKHGKQYFLSNYVIVHPNDVVKTIRGEARRVRNQKKDSKEFLFNLLFFHSRWEQFTQWDVHNIYRFEKRTGGATAL